jgi:hypothetical protein
MKFLSGKSLSAAIRRVTSGADVRCAVAFWGKGAAQALGLTGGAKKTGPRIICDISMGGTNAAELKALGAPKSSRLRYRDDFHAKVYFSDKGVVIASANASDRSVGFQAEGKLIEAGVFAEHDRARGTLWSGAAEWFDDQWEKSKQVNGPALARATELWNKRQAAALRRGAPVGGPTTRASLLGLVRSNPQLFDDIGFVFVSWRSDAKDRAERFKRDSARLEASGEKFVQFTDWESDFERWPSHFFEIWKPKDRLYLFWREKRAILPIDKADTLYAKPLGWREIGPVGKLLLSRPAILNEDGPLLRRIFEREQSRLFANGAEFAAELAKLG